MAEFAALLQKADAFWSGFGRKLAIFSGFFLILVTLLMVADVSGRYFLNKPIPGGVESLELALPWIAYLGWAYELVIGRHVRVTLLTDKMPLKAQLLLDTLGCVGGILFVGILFYWGWGFFQDSAMRNEYMPALIRLPWWAGKFALPLGTFVFAVQFLLRLLLNLGRLTGAISAGGKEIKELTKVVDLQV